MSSTTGFFLSPFQAQIWSDNYRDIANDPTVEATFNRMARTIFANESEELQQDLFEQQLMAKIFFGGRVYNLGRGLKNVNAFNCYAAQRSTMPVDSISNIFSDITNAAEILKTEGGIGFNFNHIRPKGTLIKGVGVGTPGVLAFMEIQDKTADVITRGSTGDIIQADETTPTKKKIRKGAQISLLDCRHPEIFAYIDAKKIPNRFVWFNMSVIITDRFMHAVEADDTWDLWFPDIKHPEYDQLWKGDFDAWEAAGLPKVIYQTIKARELWDKLIQNTYTRNEPGILFIDNAEKNNNLTRYMKVTGVNPCGEILMCADPGIVEIDGVLYEYLGDICNLGAINLTQFFTIENGFAWDAFKESVAVLVRALDNVIDISGYPLEKIKNAAMLRRKIGCGVMGYGSLLFMMGFKYGSQKANEFTEVLMREYANAAYQASAMLAKEKGAFPLWKPEMINDGYIGNSGMLTAETLDLIAAHGLRNAQLMTIAPTGTTSIFAGLVSGGVEPVFEKEYTRWVISNHRANELFEGLDAPDYRNGQFVETNDFKFSMAGDEKVLVSLDGTLMIDQNHGLRKKEICEDYGWYWVKKHRDPDAVAFAKRLGIYKTAMELSVKEHMDAFTVMSKAVDMSISKTVNLPADYPYDDFDKLFRDAWKSGVRGITTYREGTMTAVLETNKKKDKETKKAKEELKDFYEEWEGHEDGRVRIDDVQLPSEYPMTGFKIVSEGRKWYISAAFKDKKMTKPFGIFVTTNNRENDVNTYSALAAMEALATEAGILERIIEDNRKKYTGQTNINKLARTISLLLRHNVDIALIVKTLDALDDIPVFSFIYRIKKFLTKYITEMQNGMKCPECGESLMYTEGCVKCSSCSYSRC